MVTFLLFFTINVLWLQATNTVLTSPVTTEAHAKTERMMASYVGAPGTTQEPTARNVRFTGTLKMLHI